MLLLVAGLLRGEAATFDPAAVSLRSLLGLGYLIVFGSLIAFSAYVFLLRVATPAKASTYAFVNPVVAVVLGWLVVSEPITPRVGIAAALVVAAVVLVTAGKRRPGPEAVTAAADSGGPGAGAAASENEAGEPAQPPLGGPAMARRSERAA